MNLLTIIEIVGAVLAGVLAIAGIAALIGVAWSQFNKGGKQEREDVVSSAEKLTQFWKDQADGYKEMMERKELAANEKINKLTGDLGKLQGRYDERDKQYQEVVAILKDKNPETQKFMELLTNAAIASNKFMQEQTRKDEQWMEMFAKIISVLNDIHEMSTSNHEILSKDVKIESTIVKQ